MAEFASASQNCQTGSPKPDRSSHLGIAAAVTIETEFGVLGRPPQPGPPRGFSLLRGSEIMKKSFYFFFVPLTRLALFFQESRDGDKEEAGRGGKEEERGGGEEDSGEDPLSWDAF